jgi:hypothetical protein
MTKGFLLKTNNKNPTKTTLCSRKYKTPTFFLQSTINSKVKERNNKGSPLWAVSDLPKPPPLKLSSVEIFPKSQPIILLSTKKKPRKSKSDNIWL